MNSTDYRSLVTHYEECLQRHGDNHLGVDWTREEDIDTRYQVMLELIRSAETSPVKILDFGCGTSDLYTYIGRKNIKNIEYSGLDISPQFVDVCRKKYPENKYYCLDILTTHKQLPVFDYIILNGVFTQKRDLSFNEMFLFLKDVILALNSHFKTGLAFNVMSDHVDWKREGAFHLSFSSLGDFLTKEFGRNFVFRQDYGLYEYTTYVYKNVLSPVPPTEE